MKKFYFSIAFLSIVSANAQTEIKAIENYEIKTNTPDNTIYMPRQLDKQPEYSDGIEAFYKKLKQKFWIPDNVKRQTNFISILYIFIIEKDGTVSDIKANVTGYHAPPGQGLEQEAIKAFKKMPKWVAGELNGVPVRCKTSLKLNLTIKTF